MPDPFAPDDKGTFTAKVEEYLNVQLRMQKMREFQEDALSSGHLESDRHAADPDLDIIRFRKMLETIDSELRDARRAEQVKVIEEVRGRRREEQSNA